MSLWKSLLRRLPLVTSSQRMWPPPDHWIHRDPRQVATSGGVFHMPEGLEGAYGAMKDDERGSARGLLQYLIRFVNRPLPKVTVEEIQRGPVMRPIGQKELRHLLQVAVHGPSAPSDPDLSKPSEEFLNDIRRQSARIEWAHMLEPTEAGARWSHHGFLPDFEPFLGFVKTLLMDAELRADLGHCQYRGCGNYFLSKERKLYCDEICMKDANTQDSANRKNRERARKALISRGYSVERTSAAVEAAFKAHPEAKAKSLAIYAEAMLKAVSRRTRI